MQRRNSEKLVANGRFFAPSPRSLKTLRASLYDFAAIIAAHATPHPKRSRCMIFLIRQLDSHVLIAFAVNSQDVDKLCDLAHSATLGSGLPGQFP